ncbi:MAG: hypothetical protein IT368_07505 [Candidatus Hydrogenedentes bacterium]|nr:hypothetical protein [Candidatus Hydrogenedentota bacterium]
MVRGVLAVLAVSACGVGALSVLVQERTGVINGSAAALTVSVRGAGLLPTSADSSDAETLRQAPAAGDIALLSFEALPPGAAQWHYLSPAARSSLARQVVPDHALAQLSDGVTAYPLFCDIARVDARLFVECGLAHSAVLRHGMVYACIDPAAVFLNARHDVLSWVLECAPADLAHLEWGGLPLRLLASIHGQTDLEAVKAELNRILDSADRPYAYRWGRSEAMWMSALVLATQFGENDRLRTLCQSVQSHPADPSTLVGAARLAGVVLQDMDLARRLLDEASQSMPVSLSAAEAWLLLFDDEATARQLIEKAELTLRLSSDSKSPVDAPQWRSLGLAWWDLLGDLDAYRRCTELQADASVGVLGELCRAGQGMVRGLRASSPAPDLLRQASAQCASAGDWILCARFASDLAGDDTLARKWLEKGELLARTQQEWDLCGNLYLTRFNDASSARRCLAEAESAAMSSGDWFRCAILAARLGEPAERLRESLDAAERLAATSRDWLNCAEQAWYIFRDPGQSVAYLGRAESAEGFAESLLPIAESYLRLAAQEDKAVRIVQMAEAHAIDFRDWYGVAAFYVDRLGEPYKGRELLARAETLARSAEEKALCLTLKERLRR